MTELKNGKNIDVWGNERWYKDDWIHREDGPAITYFRGGREWFLDGSRHREDGPAVIRSNGEKEWWFNGKRLEREEWWGMIRDSMKIKILFNGEEE